ncbi:MAG TPA: Fic family protein [Bacteroidia bacterium]|jgi:Fic family protein
MEIPDIIDKIDSLSADIDRLRPLSQELEKRIMQKFRLDWNFHSNNLEGNSLTFGETRTFLLHGITAQGKPLKDHLDIKGHNEAILLLDDVIKERRPLTENFMRELHEIILHEPYYVPAQTSDGKPTKKRIEIGKYKTLPNHVLTSTGEMFYFASPEETPAKMKDLLDWYNKNKEGSMHPLELAARFHYDFIRIHPFDDGNGRMARILMNLIFMQKGYPPAIIKTQDKPNYLTALRQADGGEIKFFIIYIGQQLIHSLEIYYKGAIGENIEEMDDVEKEIALIKAKYNANISIKRTLDAQKDVFEKSLRPFFETVFAKLKDFADVFASTYYHVYFGGLPGYRSFFSSLELINFLFETFNKNSSFDSITIYIYWENLEIANKKQYTYHRRIKVDLTTNKYTVDTDGFSISKPYHETIPTEKAKEFGNIIAKNVLSVVKNELGEK